MNFKCVKREVTRQAPAIVDSGFPFSFDDRIQLVILRWTEDLIDLND